VVLTTLQYQAELAHQCVPSEISLKKLLMVAAFSIAASTQAFADSQIIHDSTHSDALGRSIPMYVYLPDG
jgi:hypothetical protein